MPRPVRLDHPELTGERRRRAVCGPRADRFHEASKRALGDSSPLFLYARALRQRFAKFGRVKGGLEELKELNVWTVGFAETSLPSVAKGDVTHARVKTSSGAVAISDLTVADKGDPDILINNTKVGLHQTVTVSSGAFQHA